MVTQDYELELVNALIGESRKAATYFLVFASLLVVAGMSSLLWLIAHSQTDRVFLGATSGICSAFSTLPTNLFFAARSHVIYFGSLRAAWLSARNHKDLPALQKLRDELSELRKGTLSKPFWALK